MKKNGNRGEREKSRPNLIYSIFLFIGTFNKERVKKIVINEVR